MASGRGNCSHEVAPPLSRSVRTVAKRPNRTGQSPRSECDHVNGRRIEPLQVVDREQHSAVVGEPIDDRQERGCHRTPVGDGVGGLLAKQHPVHRDPLRLRQISPRVWFHSFNRSASDAYASTEFACAVRADSTRNPRSRARWSPASHKVVLPIPASPSTNSAAGALAAASRNSLSACLLDGATRHARGHPRRMSATAPRLFCFETLTTSRRA